MGSPGEYLIRCERGAMHHRGCHGPSVEGGLMMMKTATRPMHTQMLNIVDPLFHSASCWHTLQEDRRLTPQINWLVRRCLRPSRT
jgi:hypothetical protein